jgi:hypothetical protein
MKTRLAAAAFVLMALAAASPAAAAYRLCARVGGFEGRNYPSVTLSIGGTQFQAPNGGHFNSGYGPHDTCFDNVTAAGAATIGWTSPRFACSGAPIPDGWKEEVWFIVTAVKTDPGLGGIMPACERHQ